MASTAYQYAGGRWLRESRYPAAPGLIALFGLFLIAAFLAIAIRGAPARAQPQNDTAETITAAMPESWPPHYIAKPGEQPTGFAVEILDAVAARAGYSVNYRVTPTMREAYDLTVDGEVDLMPNVGVVKQRMSEFSFTDPVETFVVAIFVRADTQDIEGAADLAGHRVAVIKRNMGLRLMSKRTDVESVVYDDLRSALFDLVAGRVDALVYPAPVIRNLASEVGIEDRLKAVGAPLLEVKRAIAVHPSRTEIHSRLSAAAAEFVGTPEYQAIYVRWFGRTPEYWTAYRVLAYAGGALFFFVVVFSLWHYRTIMRMNRSLEERVELRTGELRAAQAGLLRKERLATLGELTGTMAHELRNPLGSIVSSFAVIRHKLSGTGLDMERSIERVERNIGRCTGIIDDLLDYAQVKTTNRRPVALDALIADIVGDYGFDDEISVETKFGLDYRLANVDSEQIRRVVINFLDNACDAIGEQGGADGRITIETAEADEGLQISVSDNGIGIADEHRDSIFEPLYSTKPFGIGLGLPGAQNIVSDHDGRLAVQSEQGKGTQVTVWLPAADVAAEKIAS